MNALGYPWLVALLATALAATGLFSLPMTGHRARRLATGLATLLLLLASGPLFELLGQSGLRHDPFDPCLWLCATPLLQVDELSALLLPFAGLLWLVVVVITPRSLLTAPLLRRLFAAEALVLATFSCRDPLVLALLWTLSIVLLTRDLGEGPSRTRRLAQRYLGTSALLFAAGAALLRSGAGNTMHASVGIAAVAVAVMIRKGIVPLHGWLPEVFEHGRFAAATLFSAPQLAAYVATVVVAPQAPAPLLATIGALSLLTSVYGAGVALVQREPRRAFGYLFISQSALVMTGLECSSVAGLTAGLVLWLSSGLALAGFGLTIWVLEARRGPLALDRLHGGSESMPLLAAAFLLLGLASVGFPGTLGFVGHELLVAAALQEFPRIGFAVILATALNGITVVRMYFSLFCGQRAVHPQGRLRRRELSMFVLLFVTLLVGGLLPTPLVDSRARSAAAVMHEREQQRQLP